MPVSLIAELKRRRVFRALVVWLLRAGPFIAGTLGQFWHDNVAGFSELRRTHVTGIIGVRLSLSP